MIRRSIFMALLSGLACAAAGAASAQIQPAPGQPMPGQPSPEDARNPYNSREAEVRDHESSANYLSRATRDRAAARDSAKGGATAAAPSDVAAGKEVRDKKGKVVGVIEAVESDGAIVSTGSGRVKVPLEAFGKSSRGLLLGITKAEFDALVAGATASPGS